MRSAFLIGALVFLALVLVRIPAGIIHWFMPDRSPVVLLQPEGTLWNGTGEVMVEGLSAGYLSWSIRPVTFLQASVGYDLGLTGAGTELNATLTAGFARTQAEVRGSVESSFVNRWLAPYYIELGGTFRVEHLEVELSGQTLDALEGRLTWQGGPVSYRLSGNMHNSVLPPMTADLGPGPVAVAYATGESTPLLQAALSENGYVRLGVTKYLTRMLGPPWPGGDPDHAVVLEVEEQVF